jgi:hypothetical protein
MDTEKTITVRLQPLQGFDFTPRSFIFFWEHLLWQKPHVIFNDCAKGSKSDISALNSTTYEAKFTAARKLV